MPPNLGRRNTTLYRRSPRCQQQPRDAMSSPAIRAPNCPPSAPRPPARTLRDDRSKPLRREGCYLTPVLTHPKPPCAEPGGQRLTTRRQTGARLGQTRKSNTARSIARPTAEPTSWGLQAPLLGSNGHHSLRPSSRDSYASLHLHRPPPFYRILRVRLPQSRTNRARTYQGSARYLFHKRRGSVIKRNIHSNPTCPAHRGGVGIAPAT